jgi:hypothetical protein
LYRKKIPEITLNVPLVPPKDAIVKLVVDDGMGVGKN